MAIRLVLLFVPDVSEAIWNFVSCFRLTPPRLYGICCLFVYLSLLDASAASGRFILSSPYDSVAILALFVCLFVIFFLLRLKPPSPYGLSCFNSCLMPLRLHDLFYYLFA